MDPGISAGLGGTKAVLIEPVAASYLENGRTTLLVLGSLGDSDSKESRTLHIKAARFTLTEDGMLFWRMFDGPLAICLGPGDTHYILREIHEGICRNHTGAESLVHKVIRAGYYWADMEKGYKRVRSKVR
uniref:Uncharacterized protein LOC104223704 n=1 Tax=Nicotiana sylvestris TaxID=4096 RepID=A0A1U7WFS2_NICSY|nr:PREDICTED: uncharacterized protein LOC104223704 [Nicotiana sylvestris]